MPRRSVATVVFLLVGSAVLLSCAGRAWEQARGQDTAAAYADFLREHPRSRHAREARERSDLVRLRANTTREGYRKFLRDHPESALLPEVRAAVEEYFFERARATGSVAAYRDFLEEFGGGRYAARARGNAAYLEARGFGGRPHALEEFASEHPDSDFAAEARRTAEMLRLRAESAIRRVGLDLRIAPGTPETDRLTRVFTQRVLEACQGAGLELVPADAGAEAILRIEHGEEEVRTKLEASQVTSPGIRATTRMTLARRGADEAIWSEEFSLHTFAAARRGETSVLFGPGTQSYWDSFFVPVTRWSTQRAARTPHGLAKVAVAVDATPTHAYVLFGDGDFQIYETGDPERPLLAGEYRRSRDLARFEDLRVVDGGVVVFGEDGVELVALGASGPRRSKVWDRGAVGWVKAIEPVPGGLLAAGKRGLLLLPDGGGEPQRILDRQVAGLARMGERIVFTDGTSLYVTTLPLLRAQRVEGELRLGTGFAPERVRVRGQTAVVIGRRGLVQVSLANPNAPRLVSRIETSEVGAVSDATLVRGRLFLLGNRGLQIVDAGGERVVDAVSVAAEARLDAGGRHVVVVGNQALQLVDTTPFVVEGASPAALELDPDWNPGS